jgi:predicted nucleotidyltransferase
VGDKNHILQLIKDSVLSTETGATVILYGSYARGDNHVNSDIDILVLLDREALTWEDKKRVQYRLYGIEFETGVIISPMVYSKKDWAAHRVTPFYENVINEGKLL